MYLIIYQKNQKIYRYRYSCSNYHLYDAVLKEEYNQEVLMYIDPEKYKEVYLNDEREEIRGVESKFDKCLYKWYRRERKIWNKFLNEMESKKWFKGYDTCVFLKDTMDNTIEFHWIDKKIFVELNLNTRTIILATEKDNYEGVEYRLENKNIFFKELKEIIE